jgi:nicotinamidase-related amidase
LVVVDIQEKLFPRTQNPDAVLERCLKVIEFCKILKIPIVVTEQYPKGLGTTMPAVREALGPLYKPISKTAFSCFGETRFVDALEELDVETHVCVAQTALVGLSYEYEIAVLADCVSSRAARDYDIGLQRIRDEGGVVASSEMFFYEMLVEAKTEEHKAVFELLK